MKESQNKAHKYLWGSILLILVLSIIGVNKTIDIQLHDTYFVIGVLHIGILLSLYFALIGYLYWLVRNKKLINWMTWTHVIATISISIAIMIRSVFFNTLIAPRFESYQTYLQLALIAMSILLVSQLLFFLNLLISAIRNQK